MNKKVVLLVVLLVAVAAGAYMMRETPVPVPPEAAQERLGTEAALPAYDREATHLVMRVRDVEELRAGVRFLGGLMPLMEDPAVLEGMSAAYENMDIPEGMDPYENMRKMRAAMDYMNFFDAFLAAADEFALLTAAGDLGVSFFTDEGRFAALMQDTNGILNGASPWETGLAADGEEALVVRAKLPSPDDLGENADLAFYILKRAQGDRTQVLLANSEAGMGRLVGAWKDASARAVIERRLEDGNYLQYRLDLPVYGGGEAQSVFSELAWEGDGETTRLDTFADLSSMGVEPKPSGMASEPVPYFGSGEPVMLSTIDLAYLFSIAFPGTDDPVGLFISIMESSAGQQIPPQFAGDVRALLSGSRISVGCFVERDQLMPSAAYALIEMDDETVLNKYFSLASMMLQPVEVEGWERALKMEIDPLKRIALLSSGRRMLIGFGAPEAYAKHATLPEALAPMQDRGMIVGLYIDPTILFDETSAVGEILHPQLMANEEARVLLVDKLHLDAISSIVSVQADPERSETRINWKKVD